MTSKAKHRLRDAKVVLRNTEPEAVQFLATWRMKARVCRAGMDSVGISCSPLVPVSQTWGRSKH